MVHEGKNHHKNLLGHVPSYLSELVHAAVLVLLADNSAAMMHDIIMSSHYNIMDLIVSY